MVVGYPYILMLSRTQLSGPRFPPVKHIVFNDLAGIVSIGCHSNRPIMGLPVPPPNKSVTCRVGLEFTPTPVGEADRSPSGGRTIPPPAASSTPNSASTIPALPI